MPASMSRLFVPVRASQRGFTLLELMVMIAILGILSAYAVMKIKSPASLTLLSQADTLASDLRRAQSLAYTSGRRMSFTVSAGTIGTYAAVCSTGTTPCSSDFTGVLAHSVVLGSSPVLYFNTIGQPLDNAGVLRTSAASYTLSYDGSTKTVSVAAQTGLVTVTP